MENFDPRRVIADVTRRLKSQKSFSAQATSNNRPAPQAAAPSVGELMQGAEKLKLMSLNNTNDREALVKKAGKDDPENWIVISLKEAPLLPPRERFPYRGNVNKNFIYGMFGYFSHRKDREAMRA